MSFKENLLKKIRIDRLANNVLLSLEKRGNGLKVDKDSMKHLLEMASYRHVQERDLDLYVKETSPGAKRVLVLDNELALYASAIEDVALRKSPTIKEMLSIRNAIKILNDADVVVSKKAGSVETVRKECKEGLDLSFDRPDLEALAADGRVALEIGDPDGVREALALFSDLLEYQSPPRPFAAGSDDVTGAARVKENGEILFGPAVIYNPAQNSLKLVAETLSSLDKSHAGYLQQVATGKIKPAAEGAAVFQHLKEIAFAKFF